MNRYENVIIIDPKVEENVIKELIQKFSDLINSDGKVVEVNEMGKRKLAYEIKKNKEGYYVVFVFEANPQLIRELERVYRITDEVMKFMVIRQDEKDIVAKSEDKKETAKSTEKVEEKTEKVEE